MPTETDLIDPPFESETLAGAFGPPEQHVSPETMESVTRFERWSISTRGDAVWAMNMYSDAATLIAERTAERDEWVERINASYQAEIAAAVATKERFDRLLSDWACEERTDAVKTISLPNGTISTTTRQASVKVDDDDILAAWVKANKVPVETKTVVKVPAANIKPLVRIADHVVVDRDGADLADVRVVELDDGTLAAVDQIGDILDDATVLEGPFVVYTDGRRVAGMVVVPAGTTATVKPALR